MGEHVALLRGVIEVALKLLLLREGDSVYDRVEVTELFSNGLEGGVDLLWLGDVAGQHDRARALFSECADVLLHALAYVCEGEAHALPCQ